MPAIAERLPLATPKLTEIAAPNSNAASSTFTPAGVTVTPTNPPPAKSITLRRNGFSRVQKLKPTCSESSMSGIFSLAPTEMFSRLKTPTERLGIAMVNPASIPCAVTSRYGGSLKPSNGMTSLSVSTNFSGPLNSMAFLRRTTFTSGFLPGTSENSNFSKWRTRNVSGAISWRSIAEIEQDTRALGVPPGAVGAWRSTASFSVA